MRIAIKTIKGRDVNGNTIYTAFYDGKRKMQQKILSFSDKENHQDIASKFALKLGYTKSLEGAKHDEKTMFFLTSEEEQPFYQSLKLHGVELVINQTHVGGLFYFHIVKDGLINVTSNAFDNLIKARMAGYDYVKENFKSLD